jgi:hypothetical protein
MLKRSGSKTMIRTQITTLVKLLAVITAALIFAHVPEQLAHQDHSALSPHAIVSLSENAMVAACDRVSEIFRALI